MFGIQALTLSSTKRGTDLGTLVVLFEQTIHPLHVYPYYNIWFMNKYSDHLLVYEPVFRPPFEYWSAIQMPGTIVPGI